MIHLAGNLPGPLLANQQEILVSCFARQLSLVIDVLQMQADVLLAGQEAEWTIKKGALWWLSNRTRGDETQTVLRAAIPAELLE